MRARIIVFFGMIFCFAFMAGYAIAQDKKLIIRACHVDAPDSNINLTLEYMAKIVKERTNGNVIIEPHHSGDVMGGKGQVGIDLLMAGSIEMVPVNSSYYTAIVPEAAVINLPFLFSDVDAQWKWMQHGSTKILAAPFEPKGIKVNFFWPRDGRDWWNRQGPLTKPEDFKNVRIRVQEAEIYVDIMKALGARPTPMAWGEVYTALQVSAIDAVEPMVEAGYVNSLYEVARYLTVSNYTTDAMLGAYNKKFWDGLPKDIQAILTQAAVEAGHWKTELEKKKESEYIEKMKPKGVTVNYLSPEQRKAFRASMNPVYDKWQKKLGPGWTEAVIQSIRFVCGE